MLMLVESCIGFTLEIEMESPQLDLGSARTCFVARPFLGDAQII